MDKPSFSQEIVEEKAMSETKIETVNTAKPRDQYSVAMDALNERMHELIEERERAERDARYWKAEAMAEREITDVSRAYGFRLGLVVSGVVAFLAATIIVGVWLSL